jgi:hypothetical protein
MNPEIEDPEIREDDEMDGGRRRKHKGTKKRKENHVLASWRKFVRKVQHEEKITYPEAMKRASKRKSEWQRGGAAEGEEGYDGEDEQMGGSAGDMKSSDVQDFDGQYNQYGDAKVGGRRSRRRRSRGQRGGIAAMYTPPQTGGLMSSYSPASVGGSRRRRSRGTKKRRGSRRR